MSRGLKPVKIKQFTVIICLENDKSMQALLLAFFNSNGTHPYFEKISIKFEINYKKC